MHAKGPSVCGQVFRKGPPNSLRCAGDKNNSSHEIDLAGLRFCANIVLIYEMEFWAKGIYSLRQLPKVKNNKEIPDATITLTTSCVRHSHIAGGCCVHRCFVGQRTIERHVGYG